MAERLINNQRPGHSDRGKEEVTHLTRARIRLSLGFSRVRSEYVTFESIKSAAISDLQQSAQRVRWGGKL
jgi:hypothetical protein